VSALLSRLPFVEPVIGFVFLAFWADSANRKAFGADGCASPGASDMEVGLTASAAQSRLPPRNYDAWLAPRVIPTFSGTHSEKEFRA